ncbi:MAG: DEAD/DEAH box helicase [Psychrilyobacter sp.]|nr:DEAD/DEAH box helicase [Psychrilyobacter sp.]
MILEKLDKKIIEEMRIEIEKAHGNEVFFRGIPNKDGIVDRVEVIARGNKGSVPALLKRMKKREVIIHNHPSGYLFPSDADVAVASVYSNEKDGASYIVNNEVDDIYVMVEVNNTKLKKIDIVPFFEEKGPLARIFKGFEYRVEQLHMAQHIEKGLNSEKKVVVEAGTGTGKTLAYLIPAIEWAVKNEKKVVITTNTINLQEQLLYKDIPTVKKLLTEKFTYILVKGRGNYLCNRKAASIGSGGSNEIDDMSASQKDQVNYILKWFKSTDHGDKGELPFEVDYIVWENFMSETDICAGNKCAFKEACFFMKSREEKKKADVLITNHHMYFADLSIRKEVGFNTEYSILPDYDLVVFDEAHNIENVARDYFSYEASKYSFNKTMNNIHHMGKKKDGSKYTGLLNYLRNIKYKGYDEIKKEITDELVSRHIELTRRGNEYFQKVIEAFAGQSQGNMSLRLRKEELKHWEHWETLKGFEEDLLFSYNSYMRRLKSLSRVLKEIDDETALISDFIKYTERLESYFSNYNFIKEMDDKNFIYWISLNQKKSNVKFVATPLKISDELDEILYSNLDHMVFTSATIAINGSFEYFKKSIGLHEEVLEKIIDSPFDYEKQMKVYIPRDLPSPTERGFLDGIKDFVEKLVKRTKGNTFLLFTSYSTLNYLYFMLKDSFEKENFDLFIQGEAPRNQLVDMYKKSSKPVLFGTSSFWEGVDVKGDKLKSVIIVKLPFKVPSDPVVEAIIENLNEEGKNAFMEYQIPEAIIKFKQGMGRLIRSRDDRGVITILDNRIITKRYGGLFIKSIPTKNIHIKNMDDII